MNPKSYKQIIIVLTSLIVIKLKNPSNLNKYSDLSVKIGGQTAEIVSQSNDSITIKIPNMPPQAVIIWDSYIQIKIRI